MQLSEEVRPLYADLFGPGQRARDTGGRRLIEDVEASMSVLEFAGVNAAAEAEAARRQTEAATVFEPETLSPVQERAQQMKVMIDAAREESARETRQELETRMATLVQAERQRMIEVCERFARDRQRYFSAAEEQVVRLALAVAARVLHHESKADPAVLTDAVRAALGRLQEGSASVLRVPRAELGIWTKVFPLGSEPAVQVSADDRMKAGELALETVVGRVDVGIAVQLEEIARGFAELADPNSGMEPGVEPAVELRDEVEVGR